MNAVIPAKARIDGEAYVLSALGGKQSIPAFAGMTDSKNGIPNDITTVLCVACSPGSTSLLYALSKNMPPLGGAVMERYGVFKRLEDGSPMWVRAENDLAVAKLKIQEMVARSARLAVC